MQEPKQSSWQIRQVSEGACQLAAKCVDDQAKKSVGEESCEISREADASSWFVLSLTYTHLTVLQACGTANAHINTLLIWLTHAYTPLSTTPLPFPLNKQISSFRFAPRRSV